MEEDEAGAGVVWSVVVVVGVALGEVSGGGGIGSVAGSGDGASPRVTRAVMVVKGRVRVWVTTRVRTSRARVVVAAAGTSIISSPS